MADTTKDKIGLLLVDDHILFRQGLRRLLETEKDMVVVGEAANGLEAQRQAQHLSPDVILMDLAMPVLDGVEATRAIVGQSPQARVLVLTMFEAGEKVVLAIRAGACGYVTKDCPASELAAAIRAVARGEGYFSPSVAAFMAQELRRPTPRQGAKSVLCADQVRILSLLAQGMSNNAIAQHLSLSPKTVRNRIVFLFRKLTLENRTQAALFALKEGLVSLDQVRLPTGR